METQPIEVEMIEPPTRADMAKEERLAKRVLGSTQNQDIRNLAKAFLRFVNQVDKYVESVYPCFSLVEDEMRANSTTLALEDDGVFRLRKVNGEILMTGQTLKDLFVNMVLFTTDWDDEALLEESAHEEDEIFEPDRRKTKKSS